jgi:hypothetical protein
MNQFTTPAAVPTIPRIDTQLVPRRTTPGQGWPALADGSAAVARELAEKHVIFRWNGQRVSLTLWGTQCGG